MPLLESEIKDIDESKSQLIDSLGKYIVRLREELRVSELLQHSIILSLSNKTPEHEQLSLNLEQVRRTEPRHKPHIAFSYDKDGVTVSEPDDQQPVPKFLTEPVPPPPPLVDNIAISQQISDTLRGVVRTKMNPRTK